MICPGCEIWAENKELGMEISQLEAELARRDERIFQLEVENGKLKRRLALYESAKAPLPQTRRRVLLKPSSGERFTGRPRGYPGTTRPTPKPDTVVAPEWNECEVCGAPLPPPEDVDHSVIEDVSNPAPRTVTDFLIFRSRCVCCGAYNVAKHPDCPPAGRFGKNVYIQATLHKFEERLPLEKISSAFERLGLKISAPTVLELLWRKSNWLRPEYEKVLTAIRASQVVYMDQTGIGVDGANFWIWAFVTDSETLFAIRGTKSRKVLDEILKKNWQGTLVCDGLRSHHSFAKDNPGVKIQRCWAHLLNESKKMGEKYAEARALDEGLHRIFDRLKKALQKEPPPEGRTRLARNAKRAMRRLINKRYKKVKVRKFVEKIRKGYPYWFTFVIVPGIEPTNNVAERALRELVVQRKIIGTLRNEKGMRIFETLPTLLETWKQRGLSLPETLSAALIRSWKSKSGKKLIDRSKSKLNIYVDSPLCSTFRILFYLPPFISLGRYCRYLFAVFAAL